MKEALYVTMVAVKSDEALQSGRRGARKIIVTDIYTNKEKEVEDCIWKP
jgi:hypothetical protein